MNSTKQPAKKARRISAEIAPKAYKMVEEISAMTGQSVSSALQHSIQSYHHAMPARRRALWKLLREAALINSGSGHRHLSGNYKRTLSASLLRKHGGRKIRDRYDHCRHRLFSPAEPKGILAG